MDNSELKKIQDQIDAYRNGELTEEQIDDLWVDLISYPDQMEYLVNSVNLEKLASDQKSPANIIADSKTDYSWLRTIGRVAAVLLMVTGIISMIYMFNSDRFFEPSPLAEIELNSFRSSTIPSDVFEYELQRAINMASLDKHAKALEKLEDIHGLNLSAEQEIKLKLSKGSVLYNHHEYAKASEVFRSLLDEYDDLHILTEEQIHWFLGNAYLHMGVEEQALVHIRITYELNGAYRRQAERFLN
ncbi:hypothetical protein QA596_02745 [Balneolales bacterium ANBcel1]|nr:hypothetical protein [Balneolales bacterium ANBcel1]